MSLKLWWILWKVNHPFLARLEYRYWKLRYSVTVDKDKNFVQFDRLKRKKKSLGKVLWRL